MKQILVVDDEKYLREALREKLEKNGLRVVEAANGQEAINIVERLPIDLILLDLLMPGLHGTDVISKIHEIGKENIPIIILTNVDTGSYQTGVVEYLIKSETSLSTILFKIKHHLGIED